VITGSPDRRLQPAPLDSRSNGAYYAIVLARMTLAVLQVR
jgi:hypothetical protein